MAETYALMRPVFFVGFMGAGKSTVARRIARIHGVVSLDMDKYIERAQDRTISQVFAEGGEKLFRHIETETLRELAGASEPMIVSCGGGIVTMPRNIDIMHKAGVVVHLAVDADEAAGRISDKSSRPLFNDIESARRLCEERMPLYEAAADYTVSTQGKSVGRIAHEVCDLLKEEGILCQQRG